MHKPEMLFSRVRKRDGSVVAFDKNKILKAVHKAFLSVHQIPDKSSEITEEVMEDLASRAKAIPSVEEIQDVVERTLIRNRLDRVAKSYILYRRSHQDIRESKQVLGVYDDLKLGLNSIAVLERRYLKKGPDGNVIETPSQLFRRVAHAIALVDKKFISKSSIVETEQTFFEMLSKLEFLPNSPTLMNAGTLLGQLSACFVIPIDDNLSSIFDAVKATALIHQSGGGTGYSFSRLRPRGDVVKTSGGVASGPVSFMKIFDETTEQIKQGGRRRGANMGILSVYHPDIVEFITSKSSPGSLENFNISVAVDDRFMKAVLNRTAIDLVNPRTGNSVSRVSASDLFDLIASKAWETGDPGLIFIDAINRSNPTPKLGMIEATNPCAEQPLLPYESCNLGSINLSKFVDGGRVSWKRLATTVRNAVHFLDNVIDANRYPLKKIGEVTLANRKIGLGIMGFAEMLILLGIRYDSKDALKVARRVMRFIQETSHDASEELARQRGSFSNFDQSVWPKKRFSYMRNATTTTIAPTGSISLIAETTSGVEPLFALVFIRNVLEGTHLLEVNPLFEKMAKDRGFYSTDLVAKIAKNGSIQKIDAVPTDVKKIFRTALDIPPKWHVKIQAEFQKYVDAAVSKTINLSHESKVSDVKESYLLAWRLRCKGITVYRYGSKSKQVLTVGLRGGDFENRFVMADSEYSGGCAGTACSY